MTAGIMSLLRNALEVYEYLCRPLCKEMDIQQGELNILVFLGNNPDKNTALDIYKCGGMKQSMVSILVEKLVQRGFLERQPVPGDRRKVKLVCTEKAAPVVEASREIKNKLTGYAVEGVAPEDGEVFARVLAAVEQNITRCKERMLKGDLE